MLNQKKHHYKHGEKNMQLKDEGSSLVAQQVKDPALSLLWHRFDPWPGNFRMLWAWPKKKKKKKKNHKVLCSEDTDFSLRVFGAAGWHPGEFPHRLFSRTALDPLERPD